MISYSAYFAYLAAFFLAAATPGPSMLAVVSSGISRGFRPAMAIGLGVAVSDAILVTVVLAGLAVIAQSFGWLFAFVKYAGAAYLVYLGVRMWRSAGVASGCGDSTSRSLWRHVMLGAAVGFGNPKAILFHASLMPLILDVNDLNSASFVLIIATAFVVNVAIMGTYAAISGASSQRIIQSGALRYVNRVAGAAMIGSGVLIAARR